MFLVLLFAQRQECPDDHDRAVVSDEIVRQVQILELAPQSAVAVELALEVEEPRTNMGFVGARCLPIPAVLLGCEGVVSNGVV